MKKWGRGHGRVNVVVPVNVLRKSKDRLSPLLNPLGREQLTRAMLTDVLSNLRMSKAVAEIIVVSGDRGVRAISRQFDARFIWEGRRRGLNPALNLAIRERGRKSSEPFLIIHADLPLLKPSEIDRLLTIARRCSVVINPSKDGRGTNALYVDYSGIVRPSFGKNSFAKHIGQARKSGAPFKVLRLPGVRFDVDLPEDLQYLIRHKPHNNTGRFLEAVRFRARS